MLYTFLRSSFRVAAAMLKFIVALVVCFEYSQIKFKEI
jgi:hypothetical protein